jgi:hypothetical protein
LREHLRFLLHLHREQQRSIRRNTKKISLTKFRPRRPDTRISYPFTSRPLETVKSPTTPTVAVAPRSAGVLPLQLHPRSPKRSAMSGT